MKTLDEVRKTNMVNQCICQYIVVAGQLSKSQTLLLWRGVRRRVLSRTPHVAGEVGETGRYLFYLREKQYKAQGKDWQFRLSRRLCGLDNVIEYKDVVSNFGINDCCGRNVVKETEGKNES